MKSQSRTSSLAQAIADHPWASLQDALLLFSAMLVAIVLSLEYDLFRFDGQLTAKDRQITLSELIFLTVLLAAGIFAFILRRLHEHRLDAERTLHRGLETHRLRRQSQHDPVTGALNHRGVLSALIAATSGTGNVQHLHALLLLGVDGVERINDVYGRAVGDRVLKIITERFRAVTRPTDSIGRLDGNEFVVLTRDRDRQAIRELGERLIESLRAQILVDHHPHTIGIWVGATMFDEPRRTPAELLNEADLAMRRSKEARQQGPLFYDAPAAAG